jgi:hypothetical protein
MKKILCVSMLALLGTGAMAQNYKNVSNAFLLRKYDNAKLELDKLAADAKAQSSAEYWLWKAKIYASLYKDTALSSKFPGSEKVAKEAINKYLQLDPQLKLVDDPGAKDPVFDLYSTSFNTGVAVFNKKDWEAAAYNFANAVDFSDIIFKYKWSSNQAAIMDTTAILYTGVAYQNSKKPADAVKYYGRLADNKVGGKDNKDVYHYILVHYADLKDEASFNKYIAIAKEVYPDGDWDDYEMDYVNKSYDSDQKVAAFRKADASGTLNARKYLLWGSMLSDVAKDEKDSTKQITYNAAATDAFKKAYEKDNTQGIAAFNVGVIYYNEFGIYDDKQRENRRQLQQLNANKPVVKDPKKKAAAEAEFKAKTDALKKANADLDKPLMDAADAAVEWLEKAYASLKNKEPKDGITKSCLNRSIDWLANIYAYKRDKAKGKDPKAYDALDAKYKEYDALHNKY